MRSIAEARALCKNGLARALRVAAGFSMAEVAERCEVTEGAVAHWEHGRRLPRSYTAIRYGRVLAELRRIGHETG